MDFKLTETEVLAFVEEFAVEGLAASLPSVVKMYLVATPGADAQVVTKFVTDYIKTAAKAKMNSFEYFVFDGVLNTFAGQMETAVAKVVAIAQAEIAAKAPAVLAAASDGAGTSLPAADGVPLPSATYQIQLTDYVTHEVTALGTCAAENVEGQIAAFEAQYAGQGTVVAVAEPQS